MCRISIASRSVQGGEGSSIKFALSVQKRNFVRPTDRPFPAKKGGGQKKEVRGYTFSFRFFESASPLPYPYPPARYLEFLSKKFFPLFAPSILIGGGKGGTAGKSRFFGGYEKALFLSISW